MTASSSPSDRELVISLVSRNTGSNGARFAMDRDPFLMGRHEGCHLRLKSQSVSRQHCQLRIHQGRLVVRDLASRNGTSINGRRLTPKKWYALWHGDQLKIGKRRFRLSVRRRSTREAVTADSVQPTQQRTSKPVSRKPDPGTLDESLDSPLVGPDAAAVFAELDALTAGYGQPEEDGPMEASEQGDDDVSVIDTSLEALPEETTLDESRQDESVLHIDQPAQSESETDKSDQELPKIRSLPEHLKRRKSVDSQDAAQEALRRLFEGR